MSTGVIIVLIVIVIAAAVLAGAAALSPRARSALGGGSLQHRFGPEYERTVARHDGDTKAAERELTERLKRYGSLRDQPLEPSERERYTALWTAAQERFVDSPGEAVAEADRLLAEVAGARGYPGGDRRDEQFDALSVHHAPHVQGYRRLHRAAPAPGTGSQGGAGTEELRETLLEARALFEELTAPARRQPASAPAEKAPEPASARTEGRSHHPWRFHRQHAKGS